MVERNPNTDRRRAVLNAEKGGLHKEVSRLDAGLGQMLGRRWKLVQELFGIQQRLGESIIDEERKGQMIALWEENCRKNGLPAGAGTELGTIMHDFFVRLQQRMKGDQMPNK